VLDKCVVKVNTLE